MFSLQKKKKKYVRIKHLYLTEYGVKINMSVNKYKSF